VRSIAIYLPQFHPIPENDAWWMPGFTEWTNVVAARPRFPDHYQPHLPRDLGFYDLRLPDVRQAQADLARRHGVDGFCYYHYWFQGKELLQRPFEEVLKSGEPNFPFMLCWANEHWARTWDGSASQVLQAQTYSPEDDRRHIRALIPAFRDPRYLTIDGQPVFAVYRVADFPDPRATSEIWRDEVTRAGFPGIYLCRVERLFDDRSDPREAGFDAGIEFQPDMLYTGDFIRSSTIARVSRRIFRPQSPLRHNHLWSYDELVRRTLTRPPTPYTRFPGVMPSWDNSPRRKEWATIFVDSTPEKYGNWLEQTIRSFVPPSPEEDLVFTNAWNEWAEGNHLEPDVRWGLGYLEMHSRAVAHATGNVAAPASTAVPGDRAETV
jgi:lipopolysaccharide biosynthesis protein